MSKKKTRPAPTGPARTCRLCGQPVIDKQRARLDTYSISGRSVFGYVHDGCRGA